ncbi:hypothetical protein EA462_14880 [Natrarchaeobius halalkaliphilus]|uniref:Uncharacterized protein n=1 Tax=Natrarchaeobius halalkaliphilus TaxID=1679091 RepID=A0A3N6NUR7_9EURY|nr:hypothetical protein [Natrarchaeobius halalkaliphilus]RQG86940.1 hypothetical protein EA462_14880 [Natrarchaeobius halalkaliphilus]
MSSPQGWSEVNELPAFFDRLEDSGGIPVREFVAQLDEQHDLDIDADGIVYHDRGIRVPGYDATFVHEPTGSRGRPAFSVQVDTVGPRNAWEIFDDTLTWNAYLLRTEGLAAIAWLSDEEYRVEESDHFESTREAVSAGRFSFGIFLHSGEDWNEQIDRIQRTNAPAFLQREDGSTMLPSTQSEFYQYVDSTPTEFRTSGGNAPSYLGVLELEITID